MGDTESKDTNNEEKQPPWREAVKVSALTLLVFGIAMMFVFSFFAMFIDFSKILG